MTIKGVYTIHTVNVHTNEIEHVTEQSNSITFAGFSDLVSTGNQQAYMAFWFQPITPSLFTSVTNVQSSNLSFNYTTTPIPSVTPIQVVPSVGGNTTYIQYAYRINPPSLGVTRTIYSLSLASTTGTSSGNMQNRAVARLDPPCVQTDSQFIDVYYRIYLDAVGRQESYRQTTLGYLLNNTTGILHMGLTSAVPPILDKKLGAAEDRFASAGFETFVQFNLSRTSHYNGHLPVWTESVPSSSAVGRIMCSTITSHSSPFMVYSEQKFGGFPKIGNVIPHAAPSQVKWFDVDNIATGTGNVVIEGDWNHNSAPSVPGRFYASTFSTLYYIDVTGSGSATTGTYKYRKIPYFGSHNGGYDTIVPIPSTNNDGVNTSLGGTLSQHTADYMSSVHRYDDTSIVMVRPGAITVYNIAAGAVWLFEGTYTDPQQVAVLGDDIYVACRNTGLWRVNPKTETSATQVTPPGITLAKCYGVHIGFGGSLWIVAEDCLAKFDGVSTWTRYDSGTVPAFNSTGISDNNYARVSYLKVDPSHADNRMVLVRRYNAPETSFGVWWSTAGVATNAWADSTTSNRSPRTNKCNLTVLNGVWFVDDAGGVCQVSWGATVRGTTVVAASASGAMTRCNAVSIGGSVYLLAVAKNTGTSGTYRYTVTARNTSQVLTGPELVSVSSGNVDYFESTTTTIGSYASSREQSGAVQLQPGVIFLWSRSSNASGRVVSALMNCAWSSNTTGSLHELNFQSYGWNGAAWEQNHAGSKLMHTSPESLDKGMTVRFVDGVSGTSFNSGEFHTMVACDGVWKDNISTYTLRHTEYVLPTTVDCTDIESPVVTSAGVQQPTGVVGMDINKSNPWVIQNPDNSFKFDCYNGGVYMIGDKKVAGDFEINVPTTLSPNISVGICSRQGQVAAGFAWSGSSIYYSTSANIDVNQGQTSSLAGGTSISGATTLKMIKIGNALSLYRDATLLSTLSMPTGQNEFYIYAKSSERGGDYTSSNSLSDTAPPITIISNGLSTGIKLGNIANNTGVYNPKFYRICNRARLEFKLDGIPVAVVKTDRTAPNPGEVSVDLDQGIAYCNAADNGKTLTGLFTAIYLQ